MTAIGMTISQLLVAILGTTTTGQDANGNVFSKNLGAQKASIAFVCIYIFFFASTWVFTPFHFPTPLFFHPIPILSLPQHTNAFSSIGTHSLGRNWRDIPLKGPSQVPLNDNRYKLAPQLGNRLLDPISRQLRSRQCEPAEQNFLYLVRVLLFVYYVCVFYDL